MSDNNEEASRLTMLFTLDEVNIILKALSKEPFKDVFELIGNINEQASSQLNPSTPDKN
jgi:hypothetical protein